MDGVSVSTKKSKTGDDWPIRDLEELVSPMPNRAKSRVYIKELKFASFITWQS